MSSTTVKSYKKKGKGGKLITVKSHPRKIKGALHWMMHPRDPEAQGDKNFNAAKPNTKGQELARLKNRDAIMAKEAELGYDRYQNYGTASNPHQAKGYYSKNITAETPATKKTAKRKGFFANLEDSIAKKVEAKGQKYKRQL